jgi:hypothetical protein
MGMLRVRMVATLASVASTRRVVFIFPPRLVFSTVVAFTVPPTPVISQGPQKSLFMSLTAPTGNL